MADRLLRPALHRVIGIDPGTLRMGYGVVELAGSVPHYLTCGVLRAPASAPIERRLERIEQAGPKAGAYGAVGTAVGGAIVAIMAYFGVGPNGGK